MFGTLAAVGSIGLSYFDGKSKAKRANAAAEARIAIYEDEKRFLNKSFEIQTLNKRISNEMAGASRIARAAEIGASHSAAGGLALSRAMLERDLSVDKLVHQQRLKRTQREIEATRSGITNPTKEGLLSAANTGLGYAKGFIGDKVSKALKGKE